jgi:hypothetical protein
MFMFMFSTPTSVFVDDAHDADDSAIATFPTNLGGDTIDTL